MSSMSQKPILIVAATVATTTTFLFLYSYLFGSSSVTATTTLSKKNKDKRKRNPFSFTVLNDAGNETLIESLGSIFGYPQNSYQVDTTGNEKLQKSLAKKEESRLEKKKGDLKQMGEEISALLADNNDDAQKIHQSLSKPRLFVFKFHVGDNSNNINKLIELLSKFVSMVIMIGVAGKDQVLISIESPGGLPYEYGLAASHLLSLRKAGFYVNVSVDHMAASAGYLMASVAHRIVAAPFAIVGSIGVVSEGFNFNRLLGKVYVDYMLHTAGENKRDITMFGEVDDEAKKRHQGQLDRLHYTFKNYVGQFRPLADFEKVGNGDHWTALESVDMNLNLVDEILTTDDFLRWMMSKDYVALLASPADKDVEESKSLFRILIDLVFPADATAYTFAKSIKMIL